MQVNVDVYEEKTSAILTNELQNQTDFDRNVSLAIGGPPWLGSQTFLVLTPPLLMKDLGTGGSAMCHVSVDHLLSLQESWRCRVAQYMCMTRIQSPYRRCTPPLLNTCRSSGTRDYWGKSSN